MREVISGSVKKFFPDKGFGFITDDDGVEYFFHKNDILNAKIASGDFVLFKPSVGPKGSIAKQISLISFEIPSKIFFENEIPREYKILERSSYRFSIFGVDGRIIGCKNSTKNRLKIYAEAFGANALLNIQYNKGQEERTNDTIIYDDDGDINCIIPNTYYVNTHLFSANLARVGKKASSEAKKDPNLLHRIPLDTLIEESKKYLNEKSGYALIRSAALFAIIVLLFNSLLVSPSALIFIISLVIAFFVTRFIFPNFKALA